MDQAKHYRALESMYLAAPVNAFYEPRITVSHETAEIAINITESLWHAGRAVHGAVYFKLLDDAAYFAANSTETEFFMLTASFKIRFTKPISEGIMRSVGQIVSRKERKTIAEAVVYDGDGDEIGRGTGVFVKSNRVLTEVMGYGDVF